MKRTKTWGGARRNAGRARLDKVALSDFMALQQRYSLMGVDLERLKRERADMQKRLDESAGRDARLENLERAHSSLVNTVIILSALLGAVQRG